MLLFDRFATAAVVISSSRMHRALVAAATHFAGHALVALRHHGTLRSHGTVGHHGTFTALAAVRARLCGSIRSLLVIAAGTWGGGSVGLTFGGRFIRGRRCQGDGHCQQDEHDQVLHSHIHPKRIGHPWHPVGQ